MKFYACCVQSIKIIIRFDVWTLIHSIRPLGGSPPAQSGIKVGNERGSDSGWLTSSCFLPNQARQPWASGAGRPFHLSENSHEKSAHWQIRFLGCELIKNLRDLRTDTFGEFVSARSPGSNLLNCGKFSRATLIDSTHARLVFLICARSSGQSCLSWPMWISISRNDATWVLISINICNSRKLGYHGSWFMCAGGCGEAWTRHSRMKPFVAHVTFDSRDWIMARGLLR